MIDNMIRNRNEGARIRSDNLRNQGDIWANVVNNLGQIGAQTAQYYQTRDDQLADAQRAYEQQVAERIAQQKFQKEMQDAQFKHAESLQQAQQLEQKGYKEDEWQRNYELASAEYDAAMADWVMDKNDPVKKARLSKAATNMNYWGGKRGYAQTNPFEVQSEVPANTPVSTGDVTQTQQGQITNAAIDNPEWTDATKQLAEAEADKITDPGKKAEAMTAIAKRGPTKEQKKAANDAFNAQLNKDTEGEYTYSGVRQKINELNSKYPKYNFTLKKGANGKYTIVKGKK